MKGLNVIFVGIFIYIVFQVPGIIKKQENESQFISQVEWGIKHDNVLKQNCLSQIGCSSSTHVYYDVQGQSDRYVIRAQDLGYTYKGKNLGFRIKFTKTDVATIASCEAYQKMNYAIIDGNKAYRIYKQLIEI